MCIILSSFFSSFINSHHISFLYFFFFLIYIYHSFRPCFSRQLFSLRINHLSPTLSFFFLFFFFCFHFLSILRSQPPFLLIPKKDLPLVIHCNFSLSDDPRKWRNVRWIDRLASKYQTLIQSQRCTPSTVNGNIIYKKRKQRKGSGRLAFRSGNEINK